MGIRWQGYKHPELYSMINKGPGAAASEPQTSYWKDLADTLGKVDEDLNTSLTNLGAKWEGQAAESANSGLTPLASWASDAQTGSTVMRVSSENQAEYVSDARARMPEPVEVTTQAPSTWDKIAAGAALATGNAGPAADVAAQAADHEAQESAQSEAEQRAIETMQTYESSSTWNRETLGTFVAPPDVVVAMPEPQGGTANAVVYNTSETRNVAENGTRVDTGTNTTQSDPKVNEVPHPNGEDGGHLTPPPPGGNQENNVVRPPSVNPPGGTTTPQDVFTPPVTGGNPPYLPTNPGPTPGPGPNVGPNPYLPTGPFVPGGGDNNASDIARRAMPPLGPGRPGMVDPFGRGLPGGGPGGMPGGGLPGGGLPGGVDGERSPSQLGRGGALGAAPEGVVRSGPGAAGAAGARGGVGGGVNGPMGAGGRRADGEDDDEHFAPDYLMETDDVFGDDRRVAPTVIGE